MKVFLYVLAALAALAGLIILLSAKSVFQEIQAGLAFLVAAVAVGFGGVIEAIERMTGAARRAEVPTAEPRACDGCGKVTTGTRARVVVDGETKHVCPACLAALREDAQATQRQ